MRIIDVTAENIELDRVHIHLYAEGYKEALQMSQKLHDLIGSEVDVEVKKHRERRSKNANAMFWACVGDIAKHLDTDKEDVYKLMLKRYGRYTYILIPPEAKESLMAQWRECEYLGDITHNGRPASQFLCYFGSSTYNSQEFARLLDGTLSEMHEMGLETPSEQEKNQMLEQWAKEVDSA